MQSLQHDRRAGCELGQNLGRIHLVGHLGAEPGGSEIAVTREQIATGRHPDERCAHPTLGDQLVDRSLRQEVAEVTG